MRTIKKRKFSIICEPIVLEADLTREIYNEEITDSKSVVLYTPTISKFSNNRKSSIEFGSNFNFINDNSIFISNSSFKNLVINPYDLEENDFRLIFENSFKFRDFHKENQFIFEEGDNEEILLFADEKSSDPATPRGCNNAAKEHVTDVIEEFLDC